MRNVLATLTFAATAATLVAACDGEDQLERCKAICTMGAGCNTLPAGCVARCEAEDPFIEEAGCAGHANTLYDCYEGEGVCTPDLDVRCATETTALADCQGAYCLAHKDAKGCASSMP